KEGIRVNVDVRDEKIGYKIREAQTKKIPYALVLGDKEMDSGSVNVRRYGEKETKTIEVDTFIHQLKQETDHKINERRPAFLCWFFSMLIKGNISLSCC